MRTPKNIQRLAATLCLSFLIAGLTACADPKNTSDENNTNHRVDRFVTVSDGEFNFREPVLGLDSNGQPMFIVHFDYTNTTLEEKNASLIWMEHIKAFQGDERLETALPPVHFEHSNLTDRINDNILPNDTITAAFCYELIDNTTPVDLIIDKEIYGEEEATKTFNIAGLPQPEKPTPTPTPAPSTQDTPSADDASSAPKAHAGELTPQPVGEPSTKPSGKLPGKIV